jgi:hypothetical protein
MLSWRSARLFGAIIFFIGVLLLLVVFFEAKADLRLPLEGTVSTMGLALAQRFGSLFIMGFVASCLASRGCQMISIAPPPAEEREEPSVP